MPAQSEQMVPGYRGPGHPCQPWPCPLLQTGTLGALRGAQKAEPTVHKRRGPPCTPRGLALRAGHSGGIWGEVCGSGAERWDWLPGTVTTSECSEGGGSRGTCASSPRALRPQAQHGLPPHLPKKSSLSGSSSYRSTTRSCPGTSCTMNWKEREVT